MLDIEQNTVVQLDTISQHTCSCSNHSLTDFMLVLVLVLVYA